MAEEYIRGYRPKGDRPKSQMPKLEYLQQSKLAADLRRKLWDVALAEKAPCINRPEEFSGDELPTEKQAQLNCATCPSKARDACAEYAREAHPAWGVFNGTVYGARLKEAMEDG